MRANLPIYSDWLGYRPAEANKQSSYSTMEGASPTNKLSVMVVRGENMQGLQLKNQWHDHHNIQRHLSLQNPQRKVRDF